MVKGVFQEFAKGDNELAQALKAFTVFRKDKGMPLTDVDKEKLLQKLQTFPRETWVAVIRQSIEKDWAGFYPAKAETANFKVSGSPDKWRNNPAYLQAIQDLLKWGKNEEGSTQ